MKGGGDYSKLPACRCFVAQVAYLSGAFLAARGWGANASDLEEGTHSVRIKYQFQAIFKNTAHIT